MFKTFIHKKIPDLYGTLRVEIGYTSDIGMDNGSTPHLLPETATLDGIKNYWKNKGALSIFGSKFYDAFDEWDLVEVDLVIKGKKTSKLSKSEYEQVEIIFKLYVYL